MNRKLNITNWTFTAIVLKFAIQLNTNRDYDN